MTEKIGVISVIPLTFKSPNIKQCKKNAFILKKKL